MSTHVMPSTTISAALRNRFPDFGYAVLVARNIELHDGSSTIVGDAMASATAPLIASSHALAEAECAAWRETYRTMGLKASRTFCSFESLYRRVRKTGIPPPINPLVDAYNAVSLKHCLCAGAYDLTRLQGDVEIRFARDGEAMTPIGSDEALVLDPRTVVYADRAGPICAHWNHRDADRTKVEASSRNVIFYFDDKRIGQGRALRAADDLAALITALSKPGVQLAVSVSTSHEEICT